MREQSAQNKKISEYAFLILVNVSREKHIYASFVTYGDYDGYVWLADADITKLQLDNFPSVLRYLRHTGSNLELRYINNEINIAEIVSWRRDGGYKEPFQRVVLHSCKGYECFNSLENILAGQLDLDNEKKVCFGKTLSKRIVPSKEEL